MAEAEVIPSVTELNWFSDFTLYQHPPCTFLLWYLTMGGFKAYELICAFLGDGSGGGGSGGGADDQNAEAAPAEGEDAGADAEPAA